MKRRGEHPPHGIGAADPVSFARRWIPRTITALVVALVLSVIAATVVGFWLSYAGLHAFAFRAGLRGPEAWAWPASVDLFILAGELGVTISAVRGERDKVAWVYLIGGAALSVLFNVVHVWLHPVWWGRYAVAAVPPIAAIAALAALMRQVLLIAITSGDTVPSKVAADAESAAEASLRATWLAGNPLSQNQLMERFGLKRPQVRELYARVIPAEPPAVAGEFPPQPVTAGPSLASATQNGAGR